MDCEKIQNEVLFYVKKIPRKFISSCLIFLVGIRIARECRGLIILPAKSIQ